MFGKIDAATDGKMAGLREDQQSVWCVVPPCEGDGGGEAVDGAGDRHLPGRGD